MRYFKFIIPVFALFIMSCDEIDEGDRIIDNSCEECIVNAEDNFIEQKNIIIEEFTGVTCNNCPTANDEAKRLANTYPGRVVLLGVHASNFAEPNPAEGFDADFRTNIGAEYFSFANPFGVPSGMVNRLDQGTNSFAKPFFSWNSEIDDIFLAGNTADIGISVSDAQYNSSNASLTVIPKFKAINDVSNRRVFWSAFVAENGIVAAQKQPDNSKDTTYVHNHVLRGGFNGTWGQPIPDFTGTVGSISCCGKTIPVGGDWVLGNLEIIILAYDRDTYEVLQTVSVGVAP